MGPPSLSFWDVWALMLCNLSDDTWHKVPGIFHRSWGWGGSGRSEYPER